MDFKKMIELRKLTEAEDQKFKEFCEQHDPSRHNLDIKKIQGDAISSNRDVEIDEDKEFNNKYDLGGYLYEKLKDIPMDPQTWHFLIIVYHKQLLNSEGKIGEVARFYIDPQKSYYPFTHLLKPIFDLYNFHHGNIELIKFLLLNPVNESSRLFLETVKRQDMMKNENFIRVCKDFFYDEKNNKIKRGVEGSLLRLITLFKQYERTYDLYSMPSNKIMKNLISKHEEFNKFNTSISIED